jgi:glycosyltransferase involved in cell wall biosynthesis
MAVLAISYGCCIVNYYFLNKSLVEKIELTILMPCLNEEETILRCIQKAKRFLEGNKISGEVLIADNGSKDGSIAIARQNGCRVVEIARPGYGAALLGGIRAAQGKYVIMGDSDDSYDFSKLQIFLNGLRDGNHLVMGNRFKGGIESGAMPFLHRYLGNPVLSFLGRLFFKIKIRDFHCGLRGFHRQTVLDLNLQTSGMEFASEMVVKSALAGLKITEVPTTLSRDGRNRPPHLRTWRDGWRHLRFLLMYSPNWLFLYPGLVMFFLSFFVGAILSIRPIKLEMMTLDIHTLLFCSMLFILGFQCVAFWFFAKVFAIENGLMVKSVWWDKFFRIFSLEKGIWLGLSVFLLGAATWLFFSVAWARAGFTTLDPVISMRTAIPSVTFIILGVQIIAYSFFFSILGLKGMIRESA